MEGPGSSIFHSTEVLQLNSSLQHQEEDEAEEEQKRRNEELHDLLDNEFGDFMNDDDLSTLNSSLQSSLENQDDKSARRVELPPLSSESRKNLGMQYTNMEGAGDTPQVSAHYQHCFRNSPYEINNQQCRQAEYGSKEQLEELYEVRVREVHHLTEQLEQLKEKAAGEKDQLFRKLALSQAEKERAAMQYTQASKLLSSSKEKVLEMEKEVETLKFNLTNVEDSNRKLSGELEAARLSVMDLEQKVSLLERGNGLKTDAFLRGIQERHEKEVQSLRNQYESIAAKLSVKGTECDELRQRLIDLSRTHEALIVEKTDTINQLMINLEESQRHCQRLIIDQDHTKIVAEKEQLEKKVYKLTADLNTIQTELKNYEAMSQCGLLGTDHSDSFTMHYKSQPSNDLNIKLRDELQRCLAGLRLKREEIKRLKSRVEDQDKVINKLREQENAYLAQANSFKKDADNLMNELHKYRSEQSTSEEVLKLRSHLSAVQSELNDLKTEKKNWENELLAVRNASIEQKLRAIDKHSAEYIQWHDKAVALVREEANKQLQAVTTDFGIRLREAQKECDEVKQLYIEVCSSKEKLLVELEGEKKANLELRNLLNCESEKLKKIETALCIEQQNKKTKLEIEQHSEKVEELKQVVKSEKNKVKKLEADLDAAHEREKHYAKTVTQEIERAKMEALQELQLTYKQNHPMLVDVATSPIEDEKLKEEDIARIVAKLEAQHQEQLEQVKQETVRCLANELSACESRHRQQLERAEEEYSRNLATFRGLIDSKTQEVEVLKQAMLEERDKLRAERENCHVTEELVARTKDLEEQLQLRDKEWQIKMNTQSDEWQERLLAHQSDVESEREKMAEAIAGWAEELQTLRKQHQEMELKSDELQNKYQTAKKTARQYKHWADGKEQHVKQEWHRITQAFKSALEVICNKAETALTYTEGDKTVAEHLETEIREIQKKLLQGAPR